VTLTPAALFELARALMRLARRRKPADVEAVGRIEDRTVEVIGDSAPHLRGDKSNG
jgi:hypothetical protein